MRARARGLAVIGCCAALVAVARASPPSGAAEEYAWALPPGFPPPAVPADNPMSVSKVALGCRLFFDTRLSVTGKYSCASCHRPELAFTDGRAVAVGATDALLQRGAMSLMNVAYSPAYTWADNQVVTLEAQLEQPLFNDHPIEMGLVRNDGAVLERLARDSDYQAQFAQAFAAAAPPLTLDNIIKAIAAFERTLVSGRAPFDRYIYDDERTALSATAQHGMELFFSERAGCAQCHFGITFAGPIVHRAVPRAQALFADNGASEAAARDSGLMAVTRRERDRGKFRVPTLRNIALTAPYMHDGRFATLEAVIDHYVSGGTRPSQIRPLDLSPADKLALRDFLHSLTDTMPVAAAAGTINCEPRHRD